MSYWLPGPSLANSQILLIILILTEVGASGEKREISARKRDMHGSLNQPKEYFWLLLSLSKAAFPASWQSSYTSAEETVIQSIWKKGRREQKKSSSSGSLLPSSSRSWSLSSFLSSLSPFAWFSVKKRKRQLEGWNCSFCSAPGGTNRTTQTIQFWGLGKGGGLGERTWAVSGQEDGQVLMANTEYTTVLWTPSTK